MFGPPRPPSLSEQLARVVKDLGQELLPEDELVAHAFLGTEEHVSTDDLVRILRDRGTPLDPSLVSRTMRMLCDLGIAQQVRLRGTSFYEHLHLEHHHDHLVCVRCGRIIEFVDSSIERKQHKVCRRHGFTPLMHRLEIRGVCADCAAGVPESRALCACLAGETVRVLEVVGGRGIRQRLLELGLTRGTQVTVIRADGPVTVELRGTRLALGRNEAAKVQVSPPLGPPEDEP
jgi:Fur family ferric uptake transcriptional regulator